MKIKLTVADMIGEIRSLDERNKKLRQHLENIEQWEANWIMDDGCWEDSKPSFSNDVYVQWLELQRERNELLGRV